MEDLRWERPYLHFVLERHGGMASGGTRAQVHKWRVNVEKGEAICSVAGYRQKQPRARALKVKPLVDRIVQAVISKDNVPEIKWQAPDRARVLVGQLIPDDGFKQTVAGRRKRFGRTLEEALGAVGWIEVPHTAPHVYQRQEKAANSTTH